MICRTSRRLQENGDGASRWIRNVTINYLTAASPSEEVPGACPPRVPLSHDARNLELTILPLRLVTMPVPFLVPRAFMLSPMGRLGWGAIFGPLVW